MKKLISVGILLCLSSGARAQQPGWCEAGGIKESKKPQEFLSELQRVVARNEVSALISMIEFPVGYGVPSGPAQLDEKTFVGLYDRILNDRVKMILAEQKLDDLYCDTGGLAVGHGEIWFGQVPGTDMLKITQFYLSKFSRAGIDSVDEVEQAERSFVRLRKAVAIDDRIGVGSMLNYPLPVTNKKLRIVLKGRDDFLNRYDSVFDARVKHALAVQRVGKLTAFTDGLMVGRGEIWFRPFFVGRKMNLRITSINN